MHNPPGGPLARSPVFLAIVLAAACGGSQVSSPQIQIDASAIRVTGLSARDTALLRERERTVEDGLPVLRVTVVREGAPLGRSVPPVAGKYEIREHDVVFTPMFGVDAGQRYAVVYNGPNRTHIAQEVGLPKAPVSATTVVSHVYPTADVVPENQLRLYVHFSAPMGSKGGLDYVRLLDADGREVKAAFLPVDAEFWNADRTRFTMFFDPGRVKRGILPNEQLGRPLEAGKPYTLVVSREWLDANGQPLKEEFRRSFRAGPADMTPIDPKTWRIEAPVMRSREPLTVTFPRPLDHGLLLRALGVVSSAGTPLEGDAAIDEGETRWRFTPREPWREGVYRLLVLTILEDLAGNRIGRAFEVDQFDRVDRGGEPDRIMIPFRLAVPER